MRNFLKLGMTSVLLSLTVTGPCVFLATPATAQVTNTKGLEQLYDDLEKINKSIETSRDRVKTLRDARFLPDVYFTLAELYVDKSRYMFAIKRLENKDTPTEELDFSGERKPKQQAIEVYQNLLDKFPLLPERDKAMFLMAHEYRELGQDDLMAQTYSKITTEYPTSTYWSESELLLGTFFFEKKKDYQHALTLFKAILDRPVGPFTPLARYKMGWVYINLNQNKDAVLAFEGVLNKDKDVDMRDLPEIYKKTDVRRDALLAMVRPYSDLNDAEIKQLGENRRDPLAYFHGLANNRISYQRVLRSLGRRLTIKNRYIAATRVYFELLRITDDLDVKREAIESVYESMINSKQRWPVNLFADEIEDVMTRERYNGAIPLPERRKDLTNDETFVRDVATRFHQRAQQTASEKDYGLAIHGYEIYLALFPNTVHSNELRLDLAESYFKTHQFVKSAKLYEELGRGQKNPAKKRDWLDSSLQAYTAALKTPAALSRVQLVQAREGLRDVGATWLQLYPNDQADSGIRFNMGRTYYDERDFNNAVRAFQGYIKSHPKASDVRLAADLILDSYNQREDYDGMIRAGKMVVADMNVDAQTRKEVAEIVKQAEYRKIQNQSGDSGTVRDYTQNLLKFAQRYKGSAIGDQALYDAFISLKAKRDPQAYDPGEQLLMQHENSKYAREVALAMGQMALTTADFRRAAKYFEIYARKYKSDAEGRDFMKNAAQIRESMGDYKLASEDFKFLGDFESVGRNEFKDANWPELAKVAGQVGGIRGAYWSGLASYRLGDRSRALPYLNDASRMKAKDYDESTMAAHALYLVAAEALKEYKSIQLVQGKEAEGVKKKTEQLAKVTQQLNTVIQFGNGRWTIAALYGIGTANQEFADFLRRSPPPAGASPAIVVQYKGLIEQQAKKYQSTASEFFKQCVMNGEKFEVFSRFVRGCESQGQLVVDEAEDTKMTAQSTEQNPAGAQAIRNQLYDKPRDIPTMLRLVSSYMQARDYSMANLILGRALEIQPNTASLIALQGINQMFVNDLEAAQQDFQAALKISSKEKDALWGLAGLYNEFKYKNKLAQTLPKAKSAGAPTPPVHPYIQALHP